MISVRSVPRNTGRRKIVSVPAPVGGWNDRDSIADMDRLDAVTLENFWPGTNTVQLRKGWLPFATGITGQVETLMTYSGLVADQFFAAAVDSIYDITAGGAIGAADVSGLTNARFQYINFATSGTTYLMAVNGADKLQGFDGSNWYEDGDASHDITGLDTATVINITVFKNRVWMVQNNTLKAWYLGSLAIAGGATALDMQGVAKLGGHLVAAETWTLDAGYGNDDYLVFITSNGEVLVWRLTDPSTPSGIALIGVYRIGSPIGRRCFLKYAGDLLVITTDGVVPLSAAIQSSRTNPKVSITDKIQNAMNAATQAYGTNFGWQIFPHPTANQLYVNVPVEEGSEQIQFVQNNITRSWCKFTGWEANCWEWLGDGAFFGSDGYVGWAWIGNSDNGAAIPGLTIQSFQEYGGPRQKQAKMVRYHLRTNGNATIFGNVNVDYDLADTSAQLTTTPSTFALWDVAQWDEDVWSSGLTNSAEWQGATGIGYTFAPFLKTATNGLSLEWSATDLILEPGGAI